MRANMYDGRCRACGLIVKAGEGWLKESKPYHTACYPKQSDGSPQPNRDTEVEQTRDNEAEIAVAATEMDLAATSEALIAKVAEGFLATVPAMVRDEVVKASRSVEIKIGNLPKMKIDGVHVKFDDILTCCAVQAWPMLVGPAGSGKTTIASQIATGMKRKFYCESRVTSEYKLLGYMDATGKYVRTQFREAYEKGGIFLLDEMDASDADALTTFNSAFSNGFCPFPDKLVMMHKDFVVMGAANTHGRGADRVYVGRNQLDGSTLDRYVVVEVEYDTIVENRICGNSEWAGHVQRVRAAIEAEKTIRHIVSPRASIYGARLLAAGMERSKVEEMCIWKGLDATNRGRVLTRMGAMA